MAFELVAGEILTAEKLNQRLPYRVDKTAPQSVTSSTTLVNDGDLTVPVEANAIYEVEALILASGDTAGDIRVAWTIPSGAATAGRVCIGPQLGMTAATNTAMVDISRNWATQQTYGVSTSTVGILEKGTLTTSATPGNLQMQWAQGTSSATATNVESGSWLRIQRIG